MRKCAKCVPYGAQSGQCLGHLTGYRRLQPLAATTITPMVVSNTISHKTSWRGMRFKRPLVLLIAQISNLHFCDMLARPSKQAENRLPSFGALKMFLIWCPMIFRSLCRRARCEIHTARTGRVTGFKVCTSSQAACYRLYRVESTRSAV